MKTTELIRKFKTGNIYRSLDYTMFVQDDHNRPIGAHPSLKASMVLRGFLPSHPISVFIDGSKLRVKDGGHRLSFAMELGLPVFFTITEDDLFSCSEISTAQKRWTPKDHLGSYVSRGNPHYIRLEAFVNETGLPVGIASNLLSAAVNTSTRKVAAGEFKIVNEAHARKVLSILSAASVFVKWGKQHQFASAVNMVLKHSKAKPETICNKIRANPSMLLQQPTTERYVELLDQLYNYRNKDMVPIALEVKQGVRVVRAEAIQKALSERGAKR